MGFYSKLLTASALAGSMCLTAWNDTQEYPVTPDSKAPAPAEEYHSRESFLNTSCDESFVEKMYLTRVNIETKFLPVTCYKKAFKDGLEFSLNFLDEQMINYGIAPSVQKTFIDEAHEEFTKTYLSKEVLSVQIQHMLKHHYDFAEENSSGFSTIDKILRLKSFSNADKIELLGLIEPAYPDEVYIKIVSNPSIIWLAANELAEHFPEKLIPFLEKMENQYNLPIEKIKQPVTQKNLLHLAAYYNDKKLLSYIEKKAKNLSPFDANGYHALENTDSSELRKTLELWPVDKPIKKSDLNLKTYFQENSFNFLNMDYLDRYISIESADFNAFSTLEIKSLQYYNSTIKPELIISEYEGGSKPEDIEHITHTTRVAKGVLNELGVVDSATTISVHENPNYQFSPHNTLSELLYAKNRKENYLIISYSMGQETNSSFTATYKKSFNLSKKQFHAQEENYVFYNSAGNNLKNACLEVDDISFCKQNSSAHYHPVKNVRIGAAYKDEEENFIVEDYSEQRPALCGILPKYEGRLLSGTSFTAPAAAAIEASLAQKFARTSENENGALHEDILMALMLTAKKDGLIDERYNQHIQTIKIRQVY